MYHSSLSWPECNSDEGGNHRVENDKKDIDVQVEEGLATESSSSTTTTTATAVSSSSLSTSSSSSSSYTARHYLSVDQFKSTTEPHFLFRHNRINNSKSNNTMINTIGNHSHTPFQRQRRRLSSKRQQQQQQQRWQWYNNSILIPVMLLTGLLLTTIGSHLLFLSQVASYRNQHQQQQLQLIQQIQQQQQQQQQRYRPEQFNCSEKIEKTTSATAAAIATSDSATVLGVAMNYDISVHQRFVGSLRHTGYRGKM
jgi:hypothetical protein